MSTQQLFAHYLAFGRSAKLGRGLQATGASNQLSSIPQETGAQISKLFEKLAGSVELRAVYSCGGFRPDTDVLFWLTSHSVEALQEMFVSLRKLLGRCLLVPSHIFLGVVRPAEFNPDHVPAFARGEPPKKYICAYPFVRTADWYLMEPAKRAALLREHGEMGREYPDVLSNTTSGFGLGDWEWILAFESDDLVRIVDCIRRLRDAQARRYTALDTPFLVGIRKPLEQVLQDLS